MIGIIIVALIVTAIDLITKYIVRMSLPYATPVTVIKGFFDLTYTLNDGVAFSFKISSDPTVNLIIQTLIAVFALVFFVYLARKVVFKKQKWYAFALGLMMGGTLGNVVDRLFSSTHSVTDFFAFTLYYPWFEGGKLILASSPFAIFNVADSALNVGVFMFIIYLLFLDPDTHHKKGKDVEKKEDEPDQVICIGGKNHE